MENKDGGPAFPQVGPSIYETIDGMSLRDWFAGQAMVGIIKTADGATIRNWAIEKMAVDCYELADAMLRERAK
jgi:hypothetical protein